MRKSQREKDTEKKIEFEGYESSWKGHEKRPRSVASAQRPGDFWLLFLFVFVSFSLVIALLRYNLCGCWF